MYSDYESDADTYFLDDESVDTLDDAQCEVDRWVENDEPSRFHTLYDALFRTPGCPFEKVVAGHAFPRPRVHPLSAKPLSGLLDVSTIARDCAQWVEASRAATPPATAESAKTAAVTPVVTVELKPSSRERVDCADGSWYEAKPTRVSQFLSAHVSECLLFPIPTDMNRAALILRHSADPLALPELHVGYRGRDAVGWALPLTTDPAVLAHFRAAYADARPATLGDVSLFAKWVHLSATSASSTSPATAGTGAVPATASLSRYIVQHNMSPEHLLKAVEAAGGWAKVRFVAVDVEAFAVRKGGEPLPAEVALRASPGTPGSRPLYDTFFVHPGSLDVETVQNAEYTATQVHFIPYAEDTLLQNNYGQLAKRLGRHVLDKQVILINKGSIMDVEALLWIFAAGSLQARCIEGTASGVADIPADAPLEVPTLDDLACFDISALKLALARTFPDTDVSAPPAVANLPKVRPCKYHRMMKAEVRAQDFLYEDDLKVHCACEDAGTLLNGITALMCAYGLHSVEV